MRAAGLRTLPEVTPRYRRSGASVGKLGLRAFEASSRSPGMARWRRSLVWLRGTSGRWDLRLRRQVREPKFGPSMALPGNALDARPVRRRGLTYKREAAIREHSGRRAGMSRSTPQSSARWRLRRKALTIGTNHPDRTAFLGGSYEWCSVDP